MIGEEYKILYPAENQPQTFALISDSQVIRKPFLTLKDGFVKFEELLAQMMYHHSIDLLIHGYSNISDSTGGDFVQVGSHLRDWQDDWLDILGQKLKPSNDQRLVPVMYARGNHDNFYTHYTWFYWFLTNINPGKVLCITLKQWDLYGGYFWTQTTTPRLNWNG